MPTLHNLYHQHRHLYGSVPPLSNPNSCQVCLGICGESFTICPGCRTANLKLHLDAGQRGMVIPLSTAFISGLTPQADWYRALRSYKRTEADFNTHHEKIAALLGVGLHIHNDRFSEVLGGPADRLAVVPSRQERYRDPNMVVQQPLYRIMARIQLPDEQTLAPALVHTGAALRHTVNVTAFCCTDPSIRTQRVILIDDSLVTGGSSASARACLLAHGVESVIIVTAARVISPTFADDVGAAAYIAAASQQHDPQRWPRQD